MRPCARSVAHVHFLRACPDRHSKSARRLYQKWGGKNYDNTTCYQLHYYGIIRMME